MCQPFDLLFQAVDLFNIVLRKMYYAGLCCYGSNLIWLLVSLMMCLTWLYFF